MAKVAWRAEFSVGLPAIDSQHRTILRLLNEYFDGGKEAGYASIYARLIAEVDRHFAFEEGLMAKYRYPGAAAHRQEHARLRAELATFSAGTRDPTHTGRVRMQLYRWLAEHVLSERMDRELALFLRRLGVYPVSASA